MSLARAVLTGTALISLSAVATRALGLISAPIMTRLLGPEPYGVIALLGTFVNLGGTLALFGRELGYSRFGLQGDAVARDSVEIYLWRSVLLLAAALSLSASIFWAFLQKIDSPGQASLGIYLAIAIFLSPALAMASVRRRLLGQYSRIAAASVISSVFGLIVSVSWAFAISRDAWALAAGLLATAVVNFALLGMPSPHRLMKSSGLDKRKQREVLMLGLSSVVTAPIYWAITSLDRWVLSAYAGETEVGVYAFAAQFGLLGALVTGALMMTWLPETSRAFEAQGEAALPSIGSNCMHLITGLVIVWMAVSASGGDFLRLLSSGAFHHGAVLIPWIASGVLFYGVSSLFVASLFIRGRMRFMAVAWVAGGAAGLASYALLAPRFGAIGVAIGQAIAFAVIALMTWIASLRVLAIPLPYLRLVFGSGAALGSVVLLSPQWFDNPVQSLLVKAPIGVLAAAVVALVMSPGLLSKGSARIGQFLFNHQSRS